MLGRVKPEQLKADLILPWASLALCCYAGSFAYRLYNFGDRIQQPLPEAQRVLIRTIFYIVAIVTFPLTNLIRYIQLRLNQPCRLRMERLLRQKNVMW